MQIFLSFLESYLYLLLGSTPSIWSTKKNNTLAKAHSDVGLVELGNEAVKEDDRAVLLEGGVQSASPKTRSSTSTFPIFRFFTMEEQFLIDNRLTLRAIS
ncbi:hypothetical protein NC651_020273 [Populus alba x Populus x berolinensis]|nr:hypothetical protein NC651_020273 [Populus alba x Populus x berolinensis]